MRISGVTYIPRKTHKTRNIFITILILFLLAVITVALISAYIGWTLVHPAKMVIEANSSNIVPEYSDVNFTSKSSDIKLSGWLFRAKSIDKTVILAHDYGRNRLQFEAQTYNMVKAFLDKGYNVLAFDFRNSGKSQGTRSTMGFNEKQDLLAAVSLVKNLGSKDIVILGFSMGASAGILAAAESNDVDAVIADSPYSDLKKYINHSLSGNFLSNFPFNFTVPLSVEWIGGMNIDEVSPKKVIGSVAPRPVMFVHCKNDGSTPVINSRELYSMYPKTGGGKTELWEMDGSGHLGSYSSNPQVYMDRVFRFLDSIN